MPMAFPDGHVYSREVRSRYDRTCQNGGLPVSLVRQALEDMAAKNDGNVTCPRTNTTWPFAALRKVFIS